MVRTETTAWGIAVATSFAAGSMLSYWWLARRRLPAPPELAPAGPCRCCRSTVPASSRTLLPLPDGAKPDPYDPRPRSTHLSWDAYFMSIASLSAQRSKDPKKQVGACIVNSERVIVGIGYNGFPRGCPDDALPWAKLSLSGDVLETKTPYVVHAEANAILNKNASTLAGAHLYVTLYPCCECAKLIIQSGIREVTYAESKGAGSTAGSAAVDPLYVAAARMLQLAGVVVRQWQPASDSARPGASSPGAAI